LDEAVLLGHALAIKGIYP